MDNKVFVGFTTLQYGRRADFYDYLNLLKIPAGGVIMPNHARSPAKGRNMLIEKAISLNCTHILLIDDDQTFEPDSLERLLAHDKDIICGLYLSQAYPHQSVVFDIADEDGAAFPMYLMEEPGLKPIVAAGLGFCLFKTEVFNRLEKPWIRLGELDCEEWCDDIGFFKRVREANIEIFCDTSVMIGHIGSMIIKPKYQDGVWYTAYDTGGVGAIQIPQISPKMVMK